MASSQRLMDEIEVVLLEHFGGELYEANGLASRELFKYISRTTSIAAMTTTLKAMEEEGRIVRDQPNQRRTTRIALPEYSSHPPVKAVSVMVDHAVSDIAEKLERSVNYVIDNNVEAKVKEEVKKKEKVLREEMATTIETLKAEVKSLRSELQTGTSPLEAQMDQLKAEIVDLRDKLRIAEHNAEVWKRNAMGKPRVQEMFTAIRDRLPEETRHQIDRLMKERPESR